MGLGLPAAAAHALDAAGRRIGALFPCRIVVWEAEPGFQHVYHLNTMLLARETGLAPDTETWTALVAQLEDMIDDAFATLGESATASMENPSATNSPICPRDSLLHMSEDWIDELREIRQRKGDYFREHPHSPIPQDQQGEQFPGLEYFDVDPDLRFELDLKEHDEKEEITVETTADGEQHYLRYGEFAFEIDGEEHTLQAYRPIGGEERFWVPFRDETNDEETYGAGRYLDLEPDEHQTPEGKWVLDLNQAYNPTCAYNAAYECPLIPMANWLDVRVEAGEKDYPGEPAGAHGHHH
ncbi:MAG TPA: DUF1684 domain-containing protein [Natrialbaceae archaeon]|nr:DUF1684 domain-containing protein [Natrialbaceae archaeon]